MKIIFRPSLYENKKTVISLLLSSLLVFECKGDFFCEFVFTPKAMEAHTNLLQAGNELAIDPPFETVLRRAVFKLARQADSISQETIRASLGENCPEAYLSVLSENLEDLSCLVASYNHFKRLKMKAFD